MPHSHLTPPILPTRPDHRHRYLSMKASRDSGEVTVQGFVAAALSLLALLWVLAPLAGASEVSRTAYASQARRVLLADSGVLMNLRSSHFASDVRRAQSALLAYIGDSLGTQDESQLALLPASRVCRESVRIGVSRRSDPVGALRRLSRSMTDLFQVGQSYLRSDNAHAPSDGARRTIANLVAGASALASQSLDYCDASFDLDHGLGNRVSSRGLNTESFARGLMELGRMLSRLQSSLEAAEPALVSVRD